MFFFLRITELSTLRFYNRFVTFRKREEANLAISEVFGNRRKVMIIRENKESTCILSKVRADGSYKKYLCVPDFVGQRESILHIARIRTPSENYRK